MCFGMLNLVRSEGLGRGSPKPMELGLSNGIDFMWRGMVCMRTYP